jgi:hypothetical protein
LTGRIVEYLLVVMADGEQSTAATSIIDDDLLRHMSGMARADMYLQRSGLTRAWKFLGNSVDV